MILLSNFNYCDNKEFIKIALLTHFDPRLMEICIKVLENIQPVSARFYFLGLNLVGGSEHYKDAFESANYYLRWGYLGRDLNIGKSNLTYHQFLPISSRLNMIDRLSDAGVKEGVS